MNVFRKNDLCTERKSRLLGASGRTTSTLFVRFSTFWPHTIDRSQARKLLPQMMPDLRNLMNFLTWMAQRLWRFQAARLTYSYYSNKYLFFTRQENCYANLSCKYLGILSQVMFQTKHINSPLYIMMRIWCSGALCFQNVSQKRITQSFDYVYFRLKGLVSSEIRRKLVT